MEGAIFKAQVLEGALRKGAVTEVAAGEFEILKSFIRVIEVIEFLIVETVIHKGVHWGPFDLPL
jgi:hypothetical protein